MRQNHIGATCPMPTLPRGLLAVIAGPKPPVTLEGLGTAWEAFKTHYDDREREVQAALDDQARQIAAAKLNGGDGGTMRAPDPIYTAAFRDYFKAGRSEDALIEANGTGARAKVQAAMSAGDSTSGGYLAPTEWDRKVSQAQRAKSPMRRLASVITTSVGAYSTVWNDNVVGSGWVGETAARPSTTTPGLAKIEFAAGEVYANPAISQTLLDDADFPIEEWLSGVLSDEFDRQEGIAFLSGDGVNKPRGLLTYVVGSASAGRHPGGNLDVVPSGNANTLGTTFDVLTAFKYGLAAPYRQNASWLMNSQTAGALAVIKDAGGNPIWQWDRSKDEPATLMGRPVEFDEGMPGIGANNIPIAFGDFAAGYVINDRTGVRIQRDPYTNKPFVHFYSTKRVGGGVADPRAIRLLKVAAS